MYRFIRPDSAQELPLRMLFQPAGGGLFHRACEADSYGGLVAALLSDPGYETAGIAERLQERIRIANDLVLIRQMEGDQLAVADQEETDAINVHSDGEFIHSLERIGFAALPPLD
jgi:hypothetical protein